MRSIRRFGCLAVGLLVVLAGCGDEDGGGAAGTAAEPLADAKVATGEPIKVGLVNTETARGIPGWRVGSEVAADYVDRQLGGINGRPIKYEVCKTQGTPESAIDCANRLVEAKVAFVQVGAEAGGDAMLPILNSAKIPLVGHTAIGQQQQVDPNAVFLGAAIESLFAAPLKFYKDKGKKSITFFFSDGPGAKAWADGLLKPVADKLGIHYDIVQYSPANPDWSVLAATAMAKKPDVIAGLGLVDASCTALVTALRTSGYAGDVYVGGCSKFIEAVPDQAVGVQIFSDGWRHDVMDEAPAGKKAELQTYVKAMTAAGHADLLTTAGGGFGDTMTIARILTAAKGDLTGPGVLKSLKAAKSVDAFAGPRISCDGSAWKGTTACSNSVIFYEVKAGGKIGVASDGFVGMSDLAPR
ncbi:ABC transporter substrate-binding protein [Kribbella sp. NPDC051586]|uniref:ABC transporter substrate-binding protein n=1 Tax=Kribbella sp. NPDC051586 TaxID=3364118 RepID=UPI00379F5BED